MINDKSDQRPLESGNAAGYIFEIERFAIHDGPGIRTLVFLLGCPLKCLWCANPESQALERKLMIWNTRCIGCKECLNACPNGALSWDSGVRADRSACSLCGACSKACNSNAMTIVGERMDAAQVFAKVDKDAAFYRASGGGVTFSGGEPFAQPEFLLSLAKEAKKREYHTCIETTGCASWDAIREIMPYLDLFLYDFKQMDPAAHKRYTGVGNALILDNYKRLLEYGKKIVARFPVIPGYNDSNENVEAIASFLKTHSPCCRIDLLPYHTLGVSKYQRLNMPYKLEPTDMPSQERVAEIERFFSDNGFIVGTGG